MIDLILRATQWGEISGRKKIRGVFTDGLGGKSQSREPGFESLGYPFEVWPFSFSSRRPSSLSCVNAYLAKDSGGNMSE